jgi:hypothetical protein
MCVHRQFLSAAVWLFPITVMKWDYRVRLNGADHQWGKDPPKEVVG